MPLDNKVAVYGTLRKGHGNWHRLMGTAQFVGEDTIKGTLHSLGGFPGLNLDGDRKVTVEVYDVDDDTLASLDRLEGFPGWYHRSEIDTAHGKAFIYHMTEKQLSGCPVIESGDWSKHLLNKESTVRGDYR